jgi:hypothetical protein
MATNIVRLFTKRFHGLRSRETAASGKDASPFLLISEAKRICFVAGAYLNVLISRALSTQKHFRATR